MSDKPDIHKNLQRVFSTIHERTHRTHVPYFFFWNEIDLDKYRDRYKITKQEIKEDKHIEIWLQFDWEENAFTGPNRSYIRYPKKLTQLPDIINYVVNKNRELI